MLLFDIGANRGDAVVAGLNKGYKVIAVEAAPLIYKELVKNFIYNESVIPIKFAVSDKDNESVEFYECEEDGLSTLNKEWLTADAMPYKGKGYRSIKVNTITIDTLAKIYGEPDLIKIDVEGAEWSVLRGMTKKYGMLTFEWTDVTINEHQKQLEYLNNVGYTKVGPQFIENHLEEPTIWYDLDSFSLNSWKENNSKEWISEGWKVAGLRPTADVGMLWVR